MSMQRKYNKIVTEITMLTREKAQSLLDTQTDQQRKLSEVHIARYADASKRGLWQFDGTPIRVDWFGQMIDGQHRCKMVLRTGKSVKALIIYGLDPAVFKVLDSGKRRNLGDAFRISGEIHYCTLASAVGLLDRYQKGILSGGEGRRGFRIPQIDDAIKILQEHPNLRVSIKKAMPASHILSASIGGFLHYLFVQKDAIKADEFFEKLADGEGFKKKDPIRVLRDKLLFNKTEMKKISRSCKVAIVIKAWNVFFHGGTLTKLTWRTSKRPEEPMPKVA